MSMRKKFPGSVVRANPVVPTEDSAPGIWTLEQQNQNQSRGTWPFAGDPNFKDTVLLLHGDTSQQPSIEDKSASNHEVTVTGDLRATNWNPFNLPEGYWSNYFDGDSNYLWISNIPIGTQPYTFECFVFITSGVQQYQGIFSAGATNASSIQFQLSNELMRLSSYTAQILVADAGDEVPLNTWTHLAFVRDSSNVLRFFKDGVLIKSGTDSTNWSETTADMLVGRIFNSSTHDFEGYISNLHFVVGTAKYTASFSKPTAPITPDANTKLLTCQSNGFNNKSANGGSLGSVGDAEVATFSPFSYTPTATVNNYGSYYFDGNGDYLKAANNGELDLGTGDFTIEAWLYLSSAPHDYQMIVCSDGGNQYVTLRASSVAVRITSEHQISYTTTPGANEWFHLAVVRSGTTITAYIDGVSIGTATDSGDFNLNSGGTLIGAFQGPTHYFDGYISNLRIIKGTALYTSAFTPSTKPTELTLVEGENSVKFDGSGDGLKIIDSSDLELGSSDFEIDGWIYASAFSNLFFGKRTNNSSYGTIIIGLDGSKIYARVSTSGSAWVSLASGTETITLNSWVHFRLARISTTLVLWVNGVRSQSTTLSGALVNNTEPYVIGAGATDLSQPFNGYISNLKLIVGSHDTTNTSTIVVPTSPSSGGSLLACASRYIEDRSSANHTIVANGDASVSGFNPFNEGYWSVNFDGTGDYLTVPDSSDLRMGTSDFTIEFWTYLNSKTGYTTFYDKGYTNSGGILLQSNNDLSDIRVFFGSGPDLTSSSQIPLKAWTHVALVRSSGTATLYFNGVSVGSFSSTDDLNNTSIVQIGRGSNQYELDGFISNLRITKGTGLYTSSFTPSTSPFTTTSQGATASEVKLLTCQSNRFVDNSSTGHSITASGNTSIDEKIPFTLLSRQTKLLNLQNNQDVNNRSFQDSSNLKNPVDIKSGLATPGRATQGTFSPFSGEIGKWSNYFDGTGDYLSAAYSTDFAFGSGDFTVEGWVKTPGVSGQYGTIVGRWVNNNWDLRAYSTDIGGRVMFALREGSTNTLIDAGQSITDDAWHHVVAMRTGGNIYIGIDGSIVKTQAYTGTINDDGTTALTVGKNTVNQFKGYISNVRVIKGSAIYSTSGYTVPTKPIETPTVNGEQSVYFDGNGDYLIANADSKLEFNSNQFSVEWWENRPSTQSFDIALQLSEGGDNYSMLFGYNRQVLYASSAASSWDVLNGWNMYGSYTSKFGKNKWTHICVTRDSSGQIRAFIDGVMTNNTNIGASTNIYQEENAICFGSGQGYSQNHSANIYISNARICIGSIPTDYQTSSTTNGTTIFTPSTDPFTTTSQGASNVKLLALRSKIFSDDSDNPTSMTAYNQTEIRYYNPFNDGYWSLNFDGTNDNITVPNSTNTNIGGFTEDYTLECWFKLSSITSNPRVLFGMSNGPNNQPKWLIGINMNSSATYTANKVGVYSGSGGTPGDGTYTPGFTAGTWYHFRLVYTHSGTTLKIYINGTQVVSNAGNVVSSSGAFTIGTDGEFNGDFIGNISNVRIVKGTALGSTVPTEPLTAITNTTLLTAQSGRYVDNSSNGLAITVNNDTNISEDIPFQLLSRQTKLLTCQSNRFKDEANNKTITLAGNPKVFPYAPFVPSKSYDKDVMGGSVFIDNSGTSLVSFPVRLVENIGAQDFCFELWAYFNDVASAGPGFVGFGIPGNTGSTTVSLEIVSYNLKATYATGASYQVGQSSGTTKPFQWHHIVYCRENNTLAIFLNGERVASAATSATVGTGATVFKLGSQWYADARYVSGYYSNLRVTIGRSPFKSASSSIEVPTAPFPRTIDSDLLLNFTDGAVIDNTGKNNLETQSNTKVFSYTKKFGTGSIYFDGSSDYLKTSNSHPYIYDFGTEDVTIEMFVNFSTLSGVRPLISVRTGGSGGWGLYWYLNEIYWVGGATISTSSSAVSSTGVWHHIAFVREGSTISLYIDGTKNGTNTSMTAAIDNPGNESPSLGQVWPSGMTDFHGYIDECRITKGVARYTSNFTPPVRAFKNR